MKRTLTDLLPVLCVLIAAGCVSPKVAVMEDIASLEAYSGGQERFSLKEEFWVYFYPKKPVATLAVSGIWLPYRMTAASTGPLGGWLGGRDRKFWGTLPPGTEVTVVGITRRGNATCYVVKVETTEEKLFEGAFIEIYDGYQNYAPRDSGGRLRLNEAFFRPLTD